MKYATSISLLLALATCFIFHNSGFTGTIKLIMPEMIQISITLLGFLITSLSIIISASDKSLIIVMQKNGFYHVLIMKILQCSLFSFLLFLASTISKLLPVFYEYSINLICFFLFTTLILMIIDLGWRLWLTLSFLSKNNIK